MRRSAVPLVHDQQSSDQVPECGHEAMLLSKGTRRVTPTCAAGPSALVIDDSPRALLEQEVARLQREVTRLQRFELVGRLASAVSHDVANELGVVIGYTSALLGDPSISEEGRLDLQTIQDAAERAAVLPERLQRLCRRPANAVVVCLEPLLRSLEGSLRQLAGRKVQVAIDVDADGAVIMDPVSLEQLILNMAMHACDAMPDGGPLTVRCRAVESSGDVVIEVSNDSSVGEKRGTKLGVVAQIAAEANGALEVERSATGSLVRVRIPEATRLHLS